MDLSVVVPARNIQCDITARDIAACLRSVTRCPRENIDMECIVMNNVATDETAAIVNRYAERDSRIKLVAVGEDISDIKNIGIEKAAGRYILFLDALDRLCEDAWEQIEAAVQKEYADFVAFSGIALCKNGKFKAQMLPISEGVSTDEQEARKLMYADSALSTCKGKIFKNRIIRDNNIFFRAELLVDMDSLFVMEYFEHCESYLLTKAMILYCPQKAERIYFSDYFFDNFLCGPQESGKFLRHYNMRAHLDRIHVLYEYYKNAVKRYNDASLTERMQRYYFKVLIKLFSEYMIAYCYHKSALEDIYVSALENKFVKEFLGSLGEQVICSEVDRYEYHLLQSKDVVNLRKYLAFRTCCFQHL